MVNPSSKCIKCHGNGSCIKHIRCTEKKPFPKCKKCNATVKGNKCLNCPPCKTVMKCNPCVTPSDPCVVPCKPVEPCVVPCKPVEQCDCQCSCDICLTPVFKHISSIDQGTDINLTVSEN